MGGGGSTQYTQQVSVVKALAIIGKEETATLLDGVHEVAIDTMCS